MKIFAIILLFSVISNSYAQKHIVDFDTQYQLEVANDTMIIEMKIIADTVHNAEVVKIINNKSELVRQIIHKNPNIYFKTINYNIYPRYKDNKIISWYGRYDFQLTSTDFNNLNNVLTKLQDIANYNNTKFVISQSKQHLVHSKMLKNAIKQHKIKAKMIADNFGVKSFKFIKTSINNGNKVQNPVPRIGVMSMSAKNSNPVFSADKSTLKIHINSSLEIYK